MDKHHQTAQHSSWNATTRQRKTGSESKPEDGTECVTAQQFLKTIRGNGVATNKQTKRQLPASASRNQSSAYNS
jgi:hypothetical protein